MQTNDRNLSDSTIVSALFKDSKNGQQALADLQKAGFARAEISGVGLDGGNAATTSEPKRGPASGAVAAGDTKFFSEHDSSPSGFENELVRLGFSKDDAHDLVDGVTKGGAMVTVDTVTGGANALDILKRYKGDVRSARSTAGATPAAAPVAGYAQNDTRDDTRGDRDMQLRAERLQVDKERVPEGEARIRKEVVSENQSFDVPVSHEELTIERRPVSAAEAASGSIGDSEELRVPLSEERVNVSKGTFVTDEVEVGKRSVAGVEHVTDTVRHEELVVDGDDTRGDYDKSSKRTK